LSPLDVGTRHEVTVFDGCLRDIKYLDFGTLSALLICMRIKNSNQRDIVHITPCNTTCPDHLAKVVAEMATLGAPVVRIMQVDGSDWQAVEGSHRLAACVQLGLEPVLVAVDMDASAEGHDFDDLSQDCTWGDLVEYMRDSYGTRLLATHTYFLS
jgi:hypothetical protein